MPNVASGILFWNYFIEESINRASSSMAPSSFLAMEDMQIPPGFTRLTSFTLQRVKRDDSVEAPKQSLEHACCNGDKLRKLLQDKPWVNYSGVYTISDSEDEDMPDQRPVKTLPNGVIRGCPDCEDCQKVVARWKPDESHRPILDEAPVFHPNEEEFKDPIKYIQSIQAIAEPYGICRIVPPSSWKPPPLLTEKNLWEGCKFSTRVQQINKLQNCETMCLPQYTLGGKKRQKTLSMLGNNNNNNSLETDAMLPEQFGFHSGPEFTLHSYKRYADLFLKEYFQSEANRHESITSVEEIEGEFWRIVEKPTEMIEVLYGADLDTASFGSGFPKASDDSRNSQYIESGWNLNNIPNLPHSVLSFESSNISGVKIPWLYVGMCLSSFCWHVEDHHLYSLNYMHMGAPKVWYGVPEKHAQMFESIMKKHLPHLFEEQPDLLHNLVTQFSPSVLTKEGVSVFRCVQKEGEFVLTFPRAYHSGFNCGFNCAEAVNLAPVDWFPHGQVAVELYRQQRWVNTLSHDKLLIGAANEAVRAMWNIFITKKSTPHDLEWKKFSGEDGILTKSFHVRKHAEQCEREYFCSTSQCQKMDVEFDAAVRECIFCHYDLYFSAVRCPSCPGKFACLMHAKELCLCDSSSKQFLLRYNDDDLNLLLDALRGKLSSIHKWGLTYLGLSVHLYSRAQKEGATPGHSESSRTRETAVTPAGNSVTLQRGADPTRNNVASQEGPAPTRNTVALREGPTPTRNNVFLQEGPSSAATAQNSSDMPGQPHGLPCFVQVGIQKIYNIEILEYGTIMPHELWSTREAIFPKGFRSRVSYWSAVEPNKCCNYISEILDAGLLCPLFMVSVEGNPNEVFIHASPKRCWELVVEKVNTINKNFYQENKKRGTRTNPFYVQKLGSIDGLYMFGLSNSAVLQALEALDAVRVSKYCRFKDESQYLGRSGMLASEVPYQNPNPLVRRMAPVEMAPNLNSVLQEFFKKANAEELQALQMLFRDVASSSNARQEIAVLPSKEIRSRQP